MYRRGDNLLHEHGSGTNIRNIHYTKSTTDNKQHQL
jgi:hypothetical protein